MIAETIRPPWGMVLGDHGRIGPGGLCRWRPSLILRTMEGIQGGAAPVGGPDRPGSVSGGGRPADGVRVSDADREKVISQLRERYAEGRLTHDTLDHRLEAALVARHHRDLAEVLADLPSRRRLGSAVQACWQRGRAALTGLLPRAADPVPAPRLVFPSGAQRRFTIGRDVACDMVLPDPTVSRWHAGLKREETGWVLDDLGSTNGTRLNGWRVRATVPVRDGDLVSFGAATFVMGSLGSGPGRSGAGSPATG
jgi:hypothetical protein